MYVQYIVCMNSAFLDIKHPGISGTVSYTHLLISKLQNMGIRGVSLSLIASYLHDRTQVVKVNGTRSRPIKTNVGVPQGSILGPRCV